MIFLKVPAVGLVLIAIPDVRIVVDLVVVTPARLLALAVVLPITFLGADRHGNYQSGGEHKYF